MIIDLKKYLFVGVKEELTDFFIRAQEKGFIEFITNGRKKHEVREPVKKLVDAIKILRKQPVKAPYTKGGDLAFADEIADTVLELKNEIEKLSEERRFLEAEITRVAPFGSFSFEDLDFIHQHANKVIQFFCVKTSKTHEIEDADNLIYVGTDYDLDYFISISDKKVQYPAMIEMHFDRTAEELKNHLHFVDETIHQVEAELKGYGGHLDFLRDALLQQLDIHTLQDTKTHVDFPLEGSVFSIEGWVPKNKLSELDDLTKDRALFYEPIAIEETDKIPTYMENQKTDKIGEDLVRIYDIPAATDKDPSRWVLWSFALFFAMIIADGGYGMLFLGLAIFLQKKFPNFKGGAKRFMKLFFILSTSCVLWGLFTTSFFGIQINPNGPISKISILTNMAEKKADYHKKKNDEVHQEWVKKYPKLANAQTGREMFNIAVVDKGKIKSYEMLDEFSNNILLEFSLFVGVVHICLSLLRYLKRNWANLGWVLFAIGGYLYFPVTLKATSMVEFLGWIPKNVAATVGLQLLYIGLGGAIVLALIQRRLKGIGEVAQLIQIFADILSYLRLYALALASSIMASTFNEMGVNVGLVIGSIIILAGHSVNLVLGTMGGVIHGLRLNFIEWYHYSFEGEGRLFNPLRKLKQQE